MNKLVVAAGAFSISLLLATCDIRTAQELARAAFLDPEPGLTKLDNRLPEGIMVKPEGIRTNKERR